MSLKIKYIDVPQGVQEAARAQGPGQPFSDPNAVLRGAKDVAYATLEPKGWALDGSCQLLKDAPGDFWWSENRSGEDGSFPEPAVLTLSMPGPCTATGISFTFWPAAEQWCSHMRVSWFMGTTLLAQKTVFPNAPRWTLQQTVESFDKVRVELLATNKPGQFAKVQMIEIGQSVWFGKSQIASVHMLNEIDPTLSELTVDTMTVRIRDEAGLDLSPQENQRLELYRDDALAAVQYITGSKRESRQQYTFSCQSAIGLLEQEHLGGIYEKVPVQTALSHILGSTPYELDSFFDDVTVTGYLPVSTRRQALQQLAFAIGAVVTTQGSGTIRLLPLEQHISHRFVKGHLFQGGSLDTAPAIGRVEVVSHSYAPSQEEDILLDAQQLDGEDLLLTFDAPHHSYRITGGQITGSGANWVSITAQGPVTLTAKRYTHSTLRHVKYDTAATTRDRNNVQLVEDATLICKDNALQVLDRLYKITRLRQTLSQDAVLSGQKAGQRVAAPSPWGSQLRGYITGVESDLTDSGQTGAVTILGMEVPEESVLCYAGELYAGDKEVLCS